VGDYKQEFASEIKVTISYMLRCRILEEEEYSNVPARRKEFKGFGGELVVAGGFSSHSEKKKSGLGGKPGEIPLSPGDPEGKSKPTVKNNRATYFLNWRNVAKKDPTVRGMNS